MGHRLVVQVDERGTPVAAQAYDPQGKDVPATILPLGDVRVCLPEPVGAVAAAGPTCEPLSFLPEKTSFKTGTGTLCWYYVNGRIVYYQC